MSDPGGTAPLSESDDHDTLRVSWRVAAIVWLIPVFLSATTSYIFTRLTGSPVTFWSVLVINLPIWYFWAFATPVIFRLSRILRIGWPVSVAAVLLHVAASIVAAFLDVIAGMSVAALFGIAPIGNDIVHRYLINFLSWLLTGVFTYWAVLGAGYALEYDRKLRRQQLRSSELAAELARAQLAVLRNQLHPHFLFNTLNTAVSLVRVDRAEGAVSVLTSLSDILRRLLRNAPEQEITLREELALLQAYVAIEKVRFPDRLSVEMRVCDDVMDALVPNLMLQPLVENAIRYGIGTRRTAGNVAVTARKQDGRLVLQICDDGPGLPNEWVPSMNGGVGLANTQARLQHMYGTQHEFVLGNRAVGGAEVTIIIPLRMGRVAAETVVTTMSDA